MTLDIIEEVVACHRGMRSLHRYVSGDHVGDWGMVKRRDYVTEV